MTLLPSKATSKKALKSHSWLGLAVGALLYLICLSGTVVVIGHEIARWEQPEQPAIESFSAQSAQQAYSEFITQYPPTHDVLFMMPGDELPVGYIKSQEAARFVQGDGLLTGQVAHPFLDMVTALHVHLHLPHEPGMILVSLTGVVLIALIVSGILAYRRIKKDAFKARFNHSEQRKHTDIHNRLSVWLSPFHLMFGITGAFFGLAGLISLVYADLYYEGDTGQLMQDVYGTIPVVESSGEPAKVGNALSHLKSAFPEFKPVYVNVENAGTPGQHILIGAKLPHRLIYVEQFRYNSAGEFIDYVGFSDGEVGRQAIFSVYRLHFGEFAGLAGKVIYLLAGMALTVVCATGINIWLEKRRRLDYLNIMWSAVLWGAPLSLVVNAIIAILSGHAPVWAFWAGIAGVAGVGFIRPAWVVTSKYLLTALSLGLAILLMINTATFGLCGWIGLSAVVNVALLVCLCAITARAIRQWFFQPVGA